MPRLSRNVSRKRRTGRKAKSMRSFSKKARPSRFTKTRTRRPSRGAKRAGGFRKKRSSPISIALAAVSPVNWTHTVGTTNGATFPLSTANVNVDNQQSVGLLTNVNSVEYLNFVMQQHAAASASTIGQRVYILSTKSVVQLTNFDVANMHLKIYKCTPRNGVVDNSIGNPLSLWTANDAEATEGTILAPAAAVGDAPTTYGVIPDHVIGLKTYYRVKKIDEFNLSTNQTKTLTYYGPKMWHLKNQDTAAAEFSMRPQSAFYMYICHTQPMLGVTNGLINVNSGKIGAIITDTYVSKSIHYTPAMNFQTSGLIDATGGLRFAADATDSVVNQAVA